jgi:hypothetical protein
MHRNWRLEDKVECLVRLTKLCLVKSALEPSYLVLECERARAPRIIGLSPRVDRSGGGWSSPHDLLAEIPQVTCMHTGRA